MQFCVIFAEYMAKWFSYFSVLLPLFVSFAGIGNHLHAQENISDVYLLEAVKLMNKGKYDAAASYLDKASEANPENDAVEFYKGNLAFVKNDAAGALKAYEAAERLDTANIWYTQRLAQVYYLTGRLPQAEKLYRKALRRRPFDPELLSRLADVCINEAKFNEADSLLNMVEKLAGKNDYITLSRLEMLRQSGRYAEFFSGMDDFIRTDAITGKQKCDILSRFISSNDPRFNYLHLQELNTLVDACLETDRGDTAVTHFAASFFYSIDNDDRVLALADEYPCDDVLCGMAISSNIRKKDYEAALACTDKYMSFHKDDAGVQADCHAIKGDCFQNMGDAAMAIREYKASLKLKPDNVVVLNNFAYYMSCLGINLAQCEKMSRKVIDIEPENATYLDTYGWILYKRKKYQEAKLYFKKAILQGGGQHSEILEHYACVLEALGETDLATGYREQANMRKKDGK